MGGWASAILRWLTFGRMAGGGAAPTPEPKIVTGTWADVTTTGLWGNFSGAVSGLLTGLLAYYRFEDDLTDSSGNGYDLTSSDSPTFTTSGLIGHAMATGTDNYLGGAVNPDDFTAAAWTHVIGVFNGAGPFAIGLAKTPPLAEIAECQMIGDGVSVTANFSDAINSPLVSGALSVGWHHLAITRSGTNCIAYVNGASIGTFTGGGAGGLVGRWGFDASGPDASCPADEAALWGRVLTANEIMILYNNGAGFDPTQPIPMGIWADVPVTGSWGD